jgi:hypothetical protein
MSHLLFSFFLSIILFLLNILTIYYLLCFVLIIIRWHAFVNFPEDVENDLPLSVALIANRYVVSLASFHGDCTVMIYKIVTFSMFENFLVTNCDHHNDLCRRKGFCLLGCFN